MKADLRINKNKGIKLISILRARCPACHTGKILEKGVSIRARCPHCDLNLHPEPGFYLGAMVIGFFLTAFLTIPPLIALKAYNVDLDILLAFPFIEFFFIGTFLVFYCRILWLHLEYQLTRKLNNS